MRPYIEAERTEGIVRITIIKGQKDDRIEISREDGSQAVTRFPKKGPIPHDFVHYAVEHELGLRDGFLGKVAAGHHPEAIVELAKRGGHASASRAQPPVPEIVEMIQAERLVECFEADMWGGGGDNDSLRSMAELGWEQSLVPPLELSDGAIQAIRRTIREFAERWSAMPVGESVELAW
jgi:hypothetical protein